MSIINNRANIISVFDLFEYFEIFLREKEDLVDLVLCHQGAESEDDPDTPSLQSRPLYSPPPSIEEPTSPLSAISPTQGETISRSNSSESTNQVCPDYANLLAWLFDTFQYAHSPYA